jgi:hypothetical protein
MHYNEDLSRQTLALRSPPMFGQPQTSIRLLHFARYEGTPSAPSRNPNLQSREPEPYASQTAAMTLHWHSEERTNTAAGSLSADAPVWR